MWPFALGNNLQSLEQLIMQQQQLFNMMLSASQFNLKSGMVMPNFGELNQGMIQQLSQNYQQTMNAPLNQACGKTLRSHDDPKKQGKRLCCNSFCDRTTEECVQVKINEKTFTFCVLCYQNYKDDYYCEYCIQIFDPMDEEEVDEKEWIMCELCERWNHIDCEEIQGINNIKKNKKNIDYYCRKCRARPPEERIILPKVPQKKLITKPTEPITLYKDNQKVISVSLKLSEQEIQQDLEKLRLNCVGTPPTIIQEYRKTTRRKRQKLQN